AARRLTLALKTTQPLGIAAHFRREQLDGDTIAEQNVTRAIDRAHAAFAQQRFDLVLAVENRADKTGRIFLQHFAVFGTEAQVVVELIIAGWAVLHADASLQRSSKGQKRDPQGLASCETGHP